MSFKPNTFKVIGFDDIPEFFLHVFKGFALGESCAACGLNQNEKQEKG